MKGARAFTIIEFTIAIAVAAILSAAAISRYNSYLRDQEFISGGQEIANCLQRASSQARAGATTNPPRFVRATVTYDSTTPKVDCVLEPHSLIRSDGSTTTVSLLLQGNPAENTANQPLRANNMRLAAGSTIRVVFGSLESGMPVGYSVDGLLLRQPDNGSVPATYVPFGSGFSMTASENTLRLNSAATTGCGVIQMTNIGSPVRFEPLPSCS